MGVPYQVKAGLGWACNEEEAWSALHTEQPMKHQSNEPPFRSDEPANRGYQYQPKTFTCTNKYINEIRCGRGMQWKKALSSLLEMREAGIKANSFVYSAAIDACSKVSPAGPFPFVCLRLL